MQKTLCEGVKEMKTKWVDIRVSKRLFGKMNAGEISDIEMVPEKPKKKEKPVPYLEVIYTGKPNEKPFEKPERVEFPAFCLWAEWSGELKKLGVINVRYDDNIKYYFVHDCSMQCSDVNTNYRDTDITRLFKDHDIEIVKVKIIAKRG